MTTNAVFLRTVFSKTPPGASAWVTGFAEDPHVADHWRWHGRAVVGGLPWFIKRDTNNFFAISSFRPGLDGRTEVPPWASAVLRRLSEAGLYLGPISGRPAAHRVICPWRYTHTDNDSTGTVYFEPSPDNCMSGGFKCHHGHCQGRDIRMLLRFLAIYERKLKGAAHG